jgi:hypothetical protein
LFHCKISATTACRRARPPAQVLSTVSRSRACCSVAAPAPAPAPCPFPARFNKSFGPAHRVCPSTRRSNEKQTQPPPFAQPALSRRGARRARRGRRRGACHRSGCTPRRKQRARSRTCQRWSTGRLPAHAVPTRRKFHVAYPPSALRRAQQPELASICLCTAQDARGTASSCTLANFPEKTPVVAMGTASVRTQTRLWAQHNSPTAQPPGPVSPAW